MSRHPRNRRNRPATGVATLVAAIFLCSPLPGQSGSGEPGAVSSPPGRPEIEPSPASPTGTTLRSLRVVGSALKPRENDVSYAVDVNGSCFHVTAGSAFTVWNLPITLPDGVTIDTLRIYYYDTSASALGAWFTVYDLYGAIVQEWSVSTDTSAGYSFNDSAQIGHVIDHDIYSYVVNVRPQVTGDTMRFCGFRLFYVP